MTSFQSNSQCGQDGWVNEIFRGMTYGYFVEIGAGDGIFLSNTYALEKQLNWDGLCIEPNKTSFQLLKSNRQCKCLNDFVLKDGESVKFIEYGNTGSHQDLFSSKYEYGGFSDPQNVPITKYTLVAKSLMTIFKENHLPTIIDYMSLDVEGSELEILTQYFSDCVLEPKYRIMSLSIEHNFREPQRTDIRKLLESNDFHFIKELQQDDLYVHAAFYPML